MNSKDKYIINNYGRKIIKQSFYYKKLKFMRKTLWLSVAKPEPLELLHYLFKTTI